MKEILALFLLCIAALPVFGDDATQLVPGVRAKFDIGDGEGTDYYIPVPWNVSDATSKGWSKQPRPSSLHPQLTLYCPPELSLCGLYDRGTGKIAGSQIALNQSKLANVSLDLKTQGLVEWEVENSKFWVINQYFVNDAFLQLSPAVRETYHVPNRMLPLESIWLTNNHGEIIEVPVRESQLEGTLWNVQGCMTGMGLHYYYDVNKTVCTSDNVSPWSVLYYNGTLVATLFATYGAITQDQGTKWLEDNGALIIKNTFPNVPQCQYDLAVQVISLHQWFIDNPQDTICL